MTEAIYYEPIKKAQYVSHGLGSCGGHNKKIAIAVLIEKKKEIRLFN